MFSFFMAHTLASDRVSLHDAPRDQRFGIFGILAQKSSGAWRTHEAQRFSIGKICAFLTS